LRHVEYPTEIRFMFKLSLQTSQSALHSIWGCFLLLSLFSINGGAFAEESACRPTADQFPVPQAAFQCYIESANAFLAANSLPNRTPEGITLNQPFELAASKAVPYRGKFLLIHGLNDSPYVWHDVSKALQQRGFDVRAILLPGHGTTPKHMLEVHYKEWLKVVRQHYAFWDDGNTPMYLGGFSLGGVIATVLTLEKKDISGLLLFSPAYHSRLNHLLRWSWLYKMKEEWLFGGMIMEDNPAKYNSIPINSGDQYYRITRYLKKKWKKKKIEIPALLVVTNNDSVVDIPYVKEVFENRFVSPDSRLISYSAEQEAKIGPKEISRNSAFPEYRILNQAHLSLMNSPNNLLYGGDQGLLICNGNEYPVFLACLQSKEHWFGAQHTPSPDGVAVARTTINPDFDFIFQTFDKIFAQK